MPSAEVACYTRCAQTPLSIHQQHYLHATLSVVNVRILCKQPEAFSQRSVVAKRCRVTHYGYTATIPPWLHYITLDGFLPPHGCFGLHTGFSALFVSIVILQSTVSLLGKMYHVAHQPIKGLQHSTLIHKVQNEHWNEEDRWLWLLVLDSLVWVPQTNPSK